MLRTHGLAKLGACPHLPPCPGLSVSGPCFSSRCLPQGLALAAFLWACCRCTRPSARPGKCVPGRACPHRCWKRSWTAAGTAKAPKPTRCACATATRWGPRPTSRSAWGSMPRAIATTWAIGTPSGTAVCRQRSPAGRRSRPGSTPVSLPRRCSTRTSAGPCCCSGCPLRWSSPQSGWRLHGSSSRPCAVRQGRPPQRRMPLRGFSAWGGRCANPQACSGSLRCSGAGCRFPLQPCSGCKRGPGSSRSSCCCLCWSGSGSSPGPASRRAWPGAMRTRPLPCAPPRRVRASRWRSR